MANVNRIDYGRYGGVKRIDTRRKRAPRFSKKKIYALIAVVIFVFIGVRMATMETELKLVLTFKAPAGVSYELSKATTKEPWAATMDGKVIAGNNGDKVQATASTTKMILSLAVMEKKPFSKGEKGETITITEEMYNIWGWYLNNNGSNTAVKIGEEISEYDALVSTLLASSNNMADSLAIWAFGSISEYQKYATDMLKRMGMEKTTIGKKDASGYDDATKSTAGELAMIGYYVMKNPVLSEIVSKKDATVPVAGKITNTNKLLGEAGISGIKTGYIGDASGYCIVSGYKKDGHIYTVALLGADTRSGSFNDNLTVVEGLQEKLMPMTIVKGGDEVGHYEAWWLKDVPVTASEDFSEVLYEGAAVKTELSEEGMKMTIVDNEYEISTNTQEFSRGPSLFQRFLHVFGWKK